MLIVLLSTATAAALPPPPVSAPAAEKAEVAIIDSVTLPDAICTLSESISRPEPVLTERVEPDLARPFPATMDAELNCTQTSAGFPRDFTKDSMANQVLYHKIGGDFFYILRKPEGTHDEL